MADPQQRPFKFLALSPELRNEVYKLHMHDVGHLSLVKHGRIIVCSSGLHGTCKQLNEEFSAFVAKSALFTPGQRITASIFDFDFTSLLTGVKWLVESSKETAKKNPERLGEPFGVLFVQLSISKTWSRNPNLDSFTRWQKFVSSSLSKDVHFIIDYKVSDVEDVKATANFFNSYTRSAHLPYPVFCVVQEVRRFVTRRDVREAQGDVAEVEDSDEEVLMDEMASMNDPDFNV